MHGRRAASRHRSGLGMCALLLGALACSPAEDRVIERVDTEALASTPAACAPDDGGLELPAGVCATVFADTIGGARHIAVAPNGDVFVQLMTAKKSIESGSGRGGILALRDTNADGVADTSAYFGELGGTGIGLHGGYLYADNVTRIVRYPLPAGSLTPSGPAETVVSGIPRGGHEARNFVIDGSGTMYVNIGSETNSCQVKDRAEGSPGRDPCTELETRAGIWRFDANRTGQTFGPGQRYATGIRNAVGLTLHPRTGQLYATQHGRDQLLQNWPAHYTAEESARNPAEELMLVNEGDDFGWPYCYYDIDQRKRVLAPEYGGTGTEVGPCADKKAPLAVYPGHWAPNAVLFYDGTALPPRYRDGAFVAFHGSWNRAPLPQGGYNVVFTPLSGDSTTSTFEVFADGFTGESPQPGSAEHRPSGLAQGPDGALFITDDAGGRIWRVTGQTGTREAGGGN